MRRLRAVAALAGTSPSALASEVGVSETSLALYICGQRPFPADVLSELIARVGLAGWSFIVGRVDAIRVEADGRVGAVQ